MVTPPAVVGRGGGAAPQKKGAEVLKGQTRHPNHKTLALNNSVSNIHWHSCEVNRSEADITHSSASATSKRRVDFLQNMVEAIIGLCNDSRYSGAP